MLIEIRKARLSDAEQLGRVHYQARIETYTGLLSDRFLESLSAKASEEMFRQRACANCIVAVIDGKIVGFIGYGPSQDKDLEARFGEIQGFYILKEYQGMGFGKKLLTIAKDTLFHLGMNRMSLWVLSSNTHAIAFYEKIGFVFDGKEKEEIYVTSAKIRHYLL